MRLGYTVEWEVCQSASKIRTELIINIEFNFKVGIQKFKNVSDSGGEYLNPSFQEAETGGCL